MGILWITTAIIFLPIYSFFRVDKCCPPGELLDHKDDILQCTVFRESISNEFEWFPFTSLFNISSMQLLTTKEHEMVRDWMRSPNSVHYKQNICRNNKIAFHLPPTLDHFRIIVGDGDSFELVIGVDISPETMLDETRKLPASDFCVDLYKDLGVYTAMYCPSGIKPWFRKCCTNGYFYNETSSDCSPIPSHWNVSDWRPHNETGELRSHFLAIPVTMEENNFPYCEGRNQKRLKEMDREIRCRGFQHSDVSYLRNGSVKVKVVKNLFLMRKTGEVAVIRFKMPIISVNEVIAFSIWKTDISQLSTMKYIKVEISAGTELAPDEYCGDKSWHSGGKYFEHNLVHCPSNTSNDYTKMLYGIVFLIGGFCLFVTVTISLYLPELRRKIHNKIAITHNATLMFAHFFWGISQFLTFDILGITYCSLMCVIVQFSFLGSLFWLNAMCINMSSTFRTTQKIGSQSVKSEARRYAIYSLYAWGFTALISIITVTMEFVENPPFGLPRPGFSCFCDFARHTSSVMVYFYGPMVVILIFNLVLYIFTTWKIISVYKDTKNALHHTDSKSTGGSSFQSDYQRLILYTKLFLLMGLTWVTEIINWAVGGESFLWMVFDLINLMRAIFIFVIFICKRPVLRSLNERFRSATGKIRWSESSMRSTTDAISLSTIPSRKVSQESNRKRSREHEWMEQKHRINESSVITETEETDFDVDR